MKRHIFGIIFIVTTAVSCDALRCFQCEIRSSLDFLVDTCNGQNATTCPEEANFCITNTSASIASTSDILGCHIGNNSFQDCVLAGDDELHCSVICDTDGCNSPYPTDGEFLSPGPDIAPPIPAIPPSLPPFFPPPSPDTGDIRPPPGTDIIPSQIPPEVEIPPELEPPPPPTPGIEPDNVGELSCFLCTTLNVDTLPFPLDECEGASPRPCPATEDNNCAIITSTEPGFRSVIRACVANISITSCTTVGQGRVCSEYCSTDGCNSLEGIIQEATTVSDAGTQGGVGGGGGDGGGGGGGGGAARQVQVHHIVLLSVVFALLCLS
ncbi:uncharacterized protein LOC143463305 [Clavelina lepadiformis]|uniref:uncharacterized protein LOC143463305 n=1 Tax=Clavelina lepadiformis TaxID=159417 RepID=UPI004042D4EB